MMLLLMLEGLALEAVLVRRPPTVYCSTPRIFLPVHLRKAPPRHPGQEPLAQGAGVGHDGIK